MTFQIIPIYVMQNDISNNTYVMQYDISLK